MNEACPWADAGKGPARVANHRGQKLRLMDQLRLAIRRKHYSRSTEKAYCGWARRFILFHGKRHPAEMGAEEVAAFLSHLAVQCRVAARTQNQALHAILFLYVHVLGIELPRISGIAPAKTTRRLPVVLTREEVGLVLEALSGVPRLMATLLYGSGMRLMECGRLRIKDLELANGAIIVRAGKGQKDRAVPLPRAVREELLAHLRKVKALHETDLREGAGWVELPGALDRKYPEAGRDWRWQWVFPATRGYRDPETGKRRRHDLHESVLQRSFAQAVRVSRITEPASCHTLRHSFVTHLLDDGTTSGRSRSCSATRT
jgi:integron integrase